MKRLGRFLCAVVAWAAFSVHAAQTNAIIRLFNAQASGDAHALEQAAEEVAELARKGRPLYPYVLALASRMPNPPPAARLDEATRNKYLDDWRDRIKRLAAEKNNSMAWYLLWQETGNADLLKRAADAGNEQAMDEWRKRLARRANADPKEAVARLFNARASGSVRGFEQAAEDVAEMAKLGRPICPYALAIVSRMSSPPPAARLDEATRNKYLDAWRGQIKKLAEEKNDPMALYLLSLEGNDRGFLRRAAEAGNVQAMNVWGTYLITHGTRGVSDTNEVNRILGEASRYFRSAADRNDANGLYNLGMCYMQGLGVPQDDQNAFGRFQSAAEKEHPEAMNSIALFYREGRVVEKSLERSAKFFEKSASYGNPYGEYNFALALQNGEGVAQDEARAAALLSKAADGGCVEAVDAYGMALLDGRGVQENPEAAFKCFLRAADAGYPPAMENLSKCYQYGKGVKADNRRAMEWKIRSCAARGDRNAQAWLQQNAKKK